MVRLTRCRQVAESGFKQCRVESVQSLCRQPSSTGVQLTLQTLRLAVALLCSFVHMSTCHTSRVSGTPVAISISAPRVPQPNLNQDQPNLLQPAEISFIAMVSTSTTTRLLGSLDLRVPRSGHLTVRFFLKRTRSGVGVF